MNWDSFPHPFKQNMLLKLGSSFPQGVGVNKQSKKTSLTPPSLGCESRWIKWSNYMYIAVTPNPNPQQPVMSTSRLLISEFTLAPPSSEREALASSSFLAKTKTSTEAAPKATCTWGILLWNNPLRKLFAKFLSIKNWMGPYQRNCK